MAELSKVKKQSAAQKLEGQLLAVLRELGGQTTTDEDITHEGMKMVIPETMTKKDAIKLLRRTIEAEEEETVFHHTFNYRPFDGAHALQAALKKVFGNAGIPKTTQTMFGKKRPHLITIDTGFGSTTQVPWGEITFPLIKGTLTLSETEHEELGQLFYLQVIAPRKYAAEVQGLFKVIEEELSTYSIYKGQPINGSYEFLDLSGIDPDKVIYTKGVKEQLDANVWVFPKYMEEVKAQNIPLKRAVLLEGTYGTGKTLAAFLTAQVAQENDWTFLYCRPQKDDLIQVMQTAKLYSPAVVFFEDVDVVAAGGGGAQNGVTRLLDVFDGFSAKGTEILAVLTTNHPEKIHKAMVRPGRLDAIIKFDTLDRDGVEALIRGLVGPENLGTVDYDKVYEAMQDFVPAFIKEAVDRARVVSLARNEGQIRKLETEDLEIVAGVLNNHLEMMNAAQESTEPDALGTLLDKKIIDGVKKVVQHTGVELTEGIEAKGILEVEEKKEATSQKGI